MPSKRAVIKSDSTGIDTTGLKDVTPADSFAPVYMASVIPNLSAETTTGQALDSKNETQRILKTQAVDKLIALGLSKEEVRALVSNTKDH